MRLSSYGLMKKTVTTNAAAILVVALATMTGCASVAHGTRQEETFYSVPKSANVQIDHVSYGKTPETVSLSRKENHLVEISLPGYQPANFRLTQNISGWMFGNILLGGVIGVVVDAADGAMYTLKPDAVNTGTSKIQLGDKNTITVVLMKEVPKSLQHHKIGQLKPV